MPELRKDPISARWVVVSTERGQRPSDFKGVSVPALTETYSPKCPFCQGNEKTTPPEIMAWRKDKKTKPDTPGWEVRVCDNKFPALTKSGEVNRTGVGIFDMMTGIGAHEVMVENPIHNLTLSDMSVENIEHLLWAYRERLVELSKDSRFRYILIFKNYGAAGGASLEHSHSQLIATPITPRYVKMELSAAREYFLKKERCIFCDLMRQELSSGERLVYENEFFVAFTPFASRFPFEIWILPRRHHFSFNDLPEAEKKQLAVCLKDILMRLKLVLKDPAYNYVLHTAPNALPRPGKPDYWGTLPFDFHWHIEIIPRLTKQAGFEWGSGLYINPTPPEEAAKHLRNANIS